MRKIKEKRYVMVIFISVNKIEAQYVSSIKRFADEFQNSLYNEKELENYMIIIFSIEDKKDHISTGKRVRKIYSDKMCADYLKEAVKNLQNENYYEAFTELLKNIEKKKTFNGVFEIVVPCILVSILLVAFIIATKMIVSEYKIVKRIQTFLGAIKDKKDIKTIFFKTCVICFQPLEAVNKNKEEKCCYKCIDDKIITQEGKEPNCNKENEGEGKGIKINDKKEEVLNINQHEEIDKKKKIDCSKGYCSLDIFPNLQNKETENNKNNKASEEESKNDGN